MQGIAGCKNGRSGSIKRGVLALISEGDGQVSEKRGIWREFRKFSLLRGLLPTALGAGFGFGEGL